MGRRERVQPTAEEKWEIVQEGTKSGNVSETCRRYGIAPNLFYRWKDEAEQRGRSADLDRSLDGGVQSRPPSSRSRKSHPA